MSTCRICKKAEGVICRHYRHQEAGIIVQDERVEISKDGDVEILSEEITVEEYANADEAVKAVLDKIEDKPDEEEKPNDKMP